MLHVLRTRDNNLIIFMVVDILVTTGNKRCIFSKNKNKRFPEVSSRIALSISQQTKDFSFTSYMTHHLANRSQFPQLLNANRNGHVPDNKHQYLPQFPNHRKRLRHFRRRTTLSLEYIPTFTNILFTLFKVQIMFNMLCFKFMLHVSLGWKLNFSFNLYIWDHSHIVRNGQNRKWH